jgi:hypothetical protein
VVNKKIGKELLEHSKTEGITVRGALQDLFPFIYAVSDRMSTRKISAWLEDKHDVTVSFSAIAKALQKSDAYIRETASKFYGQAAALDFYIPKDQEFSGLDVLASRSLCNVLRIEEPLQDSVGIAKSVLDGLEQSWFDLPEKYREACMVVMREQRKREGGNQNDDTVER